MLNPRVLVLHDHRGLLQAVGRVCLRYQAPLELARSQSELLEIITSRNQRPDLVIAKDAGTDDWYTVAAVLLAARAHGLHMPFIVVAEPSDRWTKEAVETAGAAVLIDDRSSRWLAPLLVQDWLERVRGVLPARAKQDRTRPQPELPVRARASAAF